MTIKFKRSYYSPTITTDIDPNIIIKKGIFWGITIIVFTYAILSHFGIELDLSGLTIISIIIFIIVISILLKQKKLNKYQNGFLKFNNKYLEIKDHKHQKLYDIKDIVEVQEMHKNRGYSSITLIFKNETERFDSDHPKYDSIRKCIFEWVYNNIENHEDVYKEIYK